MTPTTKVSIAGMAFLLESEAYHQLNAYLSRLDALYRTDPDGVEILSEIEARICELILTTQSAEMIVKQPTIERIVEQLGVPENPDSASPAHDAAPSPSAAPDTASSPYEETCSRAEASPHRPTPGTEHSVSGLARRLYRNPDGAKLGGVCSGLGAYFHIDPSLIRLAFFVPLLLTPLAAILGEHRIPFIPGPDVFGTLFGSFFLLYFILWLAIPMARTPRQKLEMEGRPVTADSIRRNLQLDFDRTQPAAKSERSASIWADLVYLLGRILLLGVKFVAGIITFALLAATILLTIVGIGVTTSSEILSSSTPIQLGNCSFYAEQLNQWPFITLLLITILLLLFVIYLLIGLITQRPCSRKVLSIGGGIWLLMLLITLISLSIWYTRHIDAGSNDVLNTSRTPLPLADSTWVEQIRIGDSIINDTVRTEYFVK